MPAIYVVTYHEFNHIARNVPLDSRFLKTDKNFIFYLIDQKVPEALEGKRCIIESHIDETLVYPGRLYLAEWTFLLAEYRHRFCEYPFFFTSSRFYEKNTTLRTDLNLEWDRLFSFFDRYQWGFLPSYDRTAPFLDVRTPVIPTSKYFTDSGIRLLSELYGPEFNNPRTSPYSGDFYCNYIGFRDRSALEAYVSYYLPIIDRFFTPDWTPKEDLKKYLVMESNYRCFKPFTLLLEAGSHQFFFDSRTPYFAMNYDGYYEVHERSQSFARISPVVTADSQQEKVLGGRSIRIASHPLREPKPLVSARNVARPTRLLASDPILSFKLRGLFEECPFHLDLDSGYGLPMLHHYFDSKRGVCVDGADYNHAPVVNNLWQDYSTQAINGDSYGHLRITADDSGAPVLFDLVTAFDIPPLKQHLYGNFVRNILVHLRQHAIVVLNFEEGSLDHSEYILSLFAREGMVESTELKAYLTPSTWLICVPGDESLRVLTNAADLFQKRLDRAVGARDYTLRYRESIIAAVETMRELIEISPDNRWTTYLLHLKDVLEGLSVQPGA